MKTKPAALTALLAVIFAAYAAAANPQVTVLGNSIDLPRAQGYIDNLKAAGIDVQTITAQDLPQHKNDPTIFILGGQHAPEGVGAIVDGILTDREKAEVLSGSDATTFAIAPNLWASRQKVMVFAGYGKEQTRQLFSQMQGDLLKTLRFNDSAFPENYSGPEVGVPPLDATQPFTEVDAYQAHSIIKNVPGITVIDVRGIPFYAAGHIPGAASIPERQLEKTVGGLNRDGIYLLYCGGNSESIRAGNMMRDAGFRRVYRLVDGYMAWRRAGYPKEK